MNSRERRRQMRAEMNKMSLAPAVYKTVLPLDFPPTPMNIPDGCNNPFRVACYPYMQGVAPANKKEETMSPTAISAIAVSQEETQEAKAFKRILNRMYDVKCEKEEALRHEYGMKNDERPSTAKELVARILAGLYVMRDEYADYDCYNPVEYITWRDPKVVKDIEGFKVALKALEKKYVETVDKIYISTGEEALKLFNKFEDLKI